MSGCSTRAFSTRPEKSDYAAASNEDFYACPGVEFTDNLGVRWVTWGEKVVWPEESFESNGRRYPCWDGQRILARGRYECSCGFAANGIVDYRELRAANAHPANLWWFYRIFPFAYDGGKLIADNTAEYLFSLRDLRWMSVDAFTRIRSPEEVAAAASTCVSVVNNLKAARELLNSRCGSYHQSVAAEHYVTQGPKIQEPVLPAAEIWAGNPFVCEDKSVKLTLVVDGQTPGKAPLLEVHNPGAQDLATRVFSPPHTPLFGGMRAAVKLPAGDSVFFRVSGQELKPEPR